MNLAPILQALRDFGVVMLNGLLVALYFAQAHWATLASLVVAGLVALGPDRAVQRTIGHRPRRRGRGSVGRATRVPVIFTAVTALVWTVVSLKAPWLTSLWGLILWLVLLAGALILPQERQNVLWTHKALLLGYAGLAYGLTALLQRPVAGWSAVMGLESQSLTTLEMLRQSLGSWPIIVTWLMYPVGCLGLLGQRLALNRTRLVSPLASTQDIVRALRTRGEG